MSSEFVGGDDLASEELVTEVKALQRQDANAKAAWQQYTDQNAGGRRDPAKHTGEFVRQFIQAYQNGSLPVHCQDNMGGGQQQEGVQLPAVTKFLQRKYPAFKQVWASYCSQYGNGFNDPMRHDMDYHARFFNWMASQAGMNMGLSAHGGGGHMVGAGPIGGGYNGGGGCNGGMGGGGGYKGHGGAGGGGYNGGGHMGAGGMGGQYGGKGGGMHNNMGGGGGYGMQHAPNMSYGAGAPPQKRMRTDDPWNAGAVSTGDPRKDTLVHSLKAFKRLGDDYKNLWGMYADKYLGGIRDPARHTVDTLQEFITNHGVQIVNPPAAQPGAGMMRAPTNYSAPTAGPRISHPPVTDQLDPMKAQLVQSIKDYQKQGPEAKEAWANFAGITRDPARHDISLLKEFATMHSLI